MNSYVAFNITTMELIIKAVSSLPASYALRGESIKAVEMDEGKLMSIHFSAMSMHRVYIPELDITGWRIEDQNTIHIER